MKNYNCPDCLMEDNQNINPCTMCKRNKQYYTYPINPITITIPDGSKDYDPCENCGNNPKNGGSGLCVCSLPYMYGKYKITCIT